MGYVVVDEHGGFRSHRGHVGTYQYYSKASIRDGHYKDRWEKAVLWIWRNDSDSRGKLWVYDVTGKSLTAV